jgi:O-acetyl-ADP-ribose deacetylase (regulator of RNase III)
MDKNRIEIIKGDITKLKVDAIVNAANYTLMGGAGVDGAIHRAGGVEISDECRKIVAKQGGCNTGEAVITTAGKLPARFVIHTVGPVWHDGNNQEEILLASCYRSALQLATDHKCKTVAFPNISTGAYGFPKQLAAKIAVKTVQDFVQQSHAIERVYLVCFDQENFDFTLRTMNL